MAVIAVAGDNRIGLAVQRGLQADGDGFLADIQMAEAADQAQAIELAGFFLETTDQQHLPVHFEEFVLRRLVRLGFGRPFTVGDRRFGDGAYWWGGLGHDVGNLVFRRGVEAAYRRGRGGTSIPVWGMFDRSPVILAKVRI